MSFSWMILGRLSQQGAAMVAAEGMTSLRDSFVDAIAPAPANGKVIAWYAVDSHDWDVVIVGEVDNDDPAYWAKSQIINGRSTGIFERSELLRLATLEDFESVLLS